MKLAMRFCTVIRVISLILMYRVRFAGTEAVAEEKASFCHPSPFPGILLERNKTDRLENGSLVHNHLVYPVGSYRDFGNETYGCVCNLQACLRKCCPRNEMLDDQPKCTRLPDRLLGSNLVLDRSQLSREIQNISSVDELFVLFEDMMCSENTTKYMLEPEQYSEDAFVLERNGTLGTSWNVFPPWTYCIDRKQFSEKIIVLVCEPANSLPPRPSSGEASQSVTIIVSIPFFLATLLVYAIIPELKNLYGKTLMCYVASLFVAYTFLVLVKLFYIPFGLCSVIAFVIHFSFLASFFWLNVMCFDIWWTFGGFRSLQGSVKQRERKKFLIYSIYAWGCASIFTGICMVMDFVPSIPENFIRPRFGEESCWFATNEAKAIYFYGPMSVTVLCNICLFISTALKIVQHKKDTAHHLRGADSRRHDDNKQWFNLYLKLFIVMGINWSMEIISWLCNNSPAYIWYLTDLTNTLQGVIIFFIFVWKDKIKRLLLKRLGCHQGSIFLRNSTRSGYHSSASRTCTTSTAPLQEKINPYASESSRDRGPTSGNNDCAQSIVL